MIKFKFIKIIIITAVLFIFASEQVLACSFGPGTYYYTPEDIDGYYPLQDTEAFLNSEYGIILSKWGPRHLYLVYKDLTNQGLTSKVKNQMLTYYGSKFGQSPLFAGSYFEDAIGQWKKIRESVSNADIEIATYKKINYRSFVNCLPNAFLTASRTLENRLRTYNKEELKIWLDGQDAVFASCGKDNMQFPDIINKEKKLLKTKSLFSKIQNFSSKIIYKIKTIFLKKPAKPKSVINVSELLQQDREYQEAAMNFYNKDLNEAEKKFKKISENLRHPWREYSALVLGRVYIRKNQFEKAQMQFQNILKDESLSVIHSGARDLLNYVNYRIDPFKRLKDAEEVLLASDDSKKIIKNLEDFSLLWYDKIYWKIHKNRIDDEYRKYEEFILERGGDFMQWLYAWFNPMQNKLDFALQKYQQTKSLPWLLTSLKLITPEHLMQQEIIQEAEKISKDSPAYLSAQYYRLKFLISIGKTKTARQEIDELLDKIDFNKIRFAKNYFLDLRMTASENLKESLKYALRELVATRWGGQLKYYEDQKLLIDNKMKQLFNESLSSDQWLDIAVLINDLIEDKNVKQQILLTAFVRSILLDNLDAADKIAQILTDYNKTLKDDLSDFIKATNKSERKFLAVLFILRYPKINYVLDNRIEHSMTWDDILSFKKRDPYKDNWWCVYPPKYNYKQYDLDDLKDFLSGHEIQKAQKENEQLYKILAPNYLTNIVNNYALTHLKDERVPEALHRTIMAARYTSFTCKDDETSKFSEKAFQILHYNYPNNYWINKTPYWYK